MTHYTSHCVAAQILAFAEIIFSFNIWVSCCEIMKFAIYPRLRVAARVHYFPSLIVYSQLNRYRDIFHKIIKDLKILATCEY